MNRLRAWFDSDQAVYVTVVVLVMAVLWGVL